MTLTFNITIYTQQCFFIKLCYVNFMHQCTYFTTKHAHVGEVYRSVLTTCTQYNYIELMIMAGQQHGLYTVRPKCGYIHLRAKVNVSAAFVVSRHVCVVLFWIRKRVTREIVQREAVVFLSFSYTSLNLYLALEVRCGRGLANSEAVGRELCGWNAMIHYAMPLQQSYFFELCGCLTCYYA